MTELRNDLWKTEAIQQLVKSDRLSRLGQLATRWYESWQEVERLNKRLSLLGDDKVMASRIRDMRDDQETACRLYAERVASTQARSATDLVWKLLIAADPKSDTDDVSKSSQDLSRSALDDLLRFLKVNQKVTVSEA